MRRLFALVLIGLAVTASGSTAAPAKRLHVAITAQSHHPKLGHTWSYSVKVTDAETRKPVRAKIHLQMWFNGVSVGEVGTHTVKNGVWKETIPARGPDAFPPAAVGQPLTLHAAVTSSGYRKASAGWKFSVVK